MGFFSGPSKYVVLRIAQSVASFALQLEVLRSLDDDAKRTLIQGMKSEGAPTSLEELTTAAASVIGEQKMGSWKKKQFLGMIHSSLVSGGMSNADAAYLTGLIELRAH